VVSFAAFRLARRPIIAGVVCGEVFMLVGQCFFG
jgi:hypothetical protein